MDAIITPRKQLYGFPSKTELRKMAKIGRIEVVLVPAKNERKLRI